MKKNPVILSSQLEALDPLKQERRHLDLKITLDFENCLGRDVVVLDRRGFEYKIPARTLSGRRDMVFSIYELIQFKDDVKLTFSETEDDSDIVDYRVKVLESLHIDSVAQRNTRKSIVSATITYDDLKNNKGGIYIKEHDLVIYIPEHYGYFVHPATVSKIVSGYLSKAGSFNEDFRFNIRINDPANKIGPRFINISGTVYEIPIVRDPSVAEGALISSSSKDSDYKFLTVPMSLEEFDKKVMTFKSVEEATVAGNLNEVEKLRLTQEKLELEKNHAVEDQKRQNEINASKHELALAQNDLKQMEIKHKRELEHLTHRYELMEDELEHQSLRRKSYYEERSLDRKDTSEVIKWLPLVLGAGIALFFR